MSPLQPGEIAQLEDIFRSDAPPRLRRLADALERLATDGSGGEVARFEAHSLRGAAAIVGREDIRALCVSIEELVGEKEPDRDELLAAARLARQEARRLDPARLPPVLTLGQRLIPRRFMSLLAVILLLALVPAFGSLVYATIHGRHVAHRELAENAVADVRLAAAAQTELLTGGARLLSALGQVPEIRSGGAAACSRLLARFASRFYPYIDFRVAERTGRVLCSSTPEHPVSVATSGVFRAVASTHRFSVGPLRGSLVVIEQPLRSARLPGAQIGAQIAPGSIQALLDGIPLPAGGSVALFDRNGSILARRPDPTQYVGTRTSLAPVRGLGSAATRTGAADGRLIAYRTAGPWYVSVALSTGPEDASLINDLVVELALLAGLGLVGFTLGLMGARRSIGRPLAALVATARRIGGGDLSARTGVASHGGELSELALSMDAMAEALERRTEERERAVADLSTLSAVLEQRVRDRTAALEEVSRQADRASRAKTEFLSRLSHELRTPLNAIRGFSQLLSVETLPPAQAEAAGHIAAGAEHMTALVEELLDSARIEAGDYRVELEPVALGEVVEEVLDFVGGLAAEHDVVLSPAAITIEGGVLADRDGLRQVLLNLVTNAVLYNRPGGVVTVQAERTATGRVLVDVLDTGQGIAAEDLADAFVPYERLGRGPETGGLGLGLSITKWIAEAMGGSIAVESDPGVGTRFTIDLPAAEEPRGVADVSRHAEPATHEGSARVLYIEDDPTSMKLVELLLIGRGVEFVGAATAAEGLAAARANPPGLIMLDFHLPDGSGEDVLRALRAEPSLRAVPIVMVSAEASRDAVRLLLEAGADDYLTKPLEVDHAAGVIERLLRRADR